MSDAQKNDQQNDDKGGNAGTYTPPATQEDLDRIIEQRLARERAKFADYEDLKAKAEAHDAYVESQKTDDQRRAEELEALRAENARLRVESLRNKVVDAVEKETGVRVPAALLTGDDEAALTAAAKALVEFRGGATENEGGVGQSQQRQADLFVPGEGRAPDTVNNEAAEALRMLGFGAR